MPRPLLDIPDGVDVLIDANILVYALGQTSKQCQDLLGRCEREEVSGFTTVEVVNETCHRLMLGEAFGRGLIPRPNAVALKKRREVIPRLGNYWVLVSGIFQSNVLILELNEARIRRAQVLRQTHSLLTTDATVLAAAQELGIERLATNDADFFSLTAIEVYHPTDVT